MGASGGIRARIWQAASRPTQCSAETANSDVDGCSVESLKLEQGVSAPVCSRWVGWGPAR